MDGRCRQAGVDLLNQAKKCHESRRKSSDGEMKSVCEEGAKFAYRKPMSVTIDTPLQVKKKPYECFICGTKGGTFHIDNGNAYCPEDKQAIGLSKEDLNEFLSKRRTQLC